MPPSSHYLWAMDRTMNMTAAIDPTAAAAPAARMQAPIPDDKALLRAAADLTREFSTARGDIYWPDFLISAVTGYAGLFGAMMLPGLWAWGAGLVAVLMLYRASLFIHELTHIRPGALPGFRFAWNVIIGVPMVLPSFMYEDVHTQHHARTRYGTIDDPEYLPLALMKPWSVPLFVLVAALAPVAFLIRFAVFSPLAAIFPGVRKLVIERYSALSINPAYRRRAPEGAFARMWRWQAAGASVFAITLIGLTVAGVIPLRAFLIYLGIFSVVAVLNQIRTLVAHLWENEGEAMTVTAQYLDSVNVPPPGVLPYLWAPVGLRFHALHHLLPSVPYHNLGKAHARLVETLGEHSTYQQANYPGLFGLVSRLVAGTFRSSSAAR